MNIAALFNWHKMKSKPNPTAFWSDTNLHFNFSLHKMNLLQIPLGSDAHSLILEITLLPSLSSWKKECHQILNTLASRLCWGNICQHDAHIKQIWKLVKFYIKEIG